jgi:transposase
MKTDVKRIDHLGIVAGIIKDLGIVELINERIPEHPKEEISAGEAVAGMIINGLGFSNRPLSLTPQFFQSKALERLFRKGIDASFFNRFKLGRALDDCYDYGCSNLFAEISLEVCKKERVDCRFNSEDTTSFSLTGEYEPDTDEQAIQITHGYSKDHRPDLKQAIVEMMVSQDGGVPTVYCAHSGNASDTQVFRDRSQALLESFKKSDSPRYLVADSKLYAQKTVKESLKHIPFITRVPGTVGLEQEIIAEMLELPIERWTQVDENNRYRSLTVRHFDLAQRWIVVFSNALNVKQHKKIEKALVKEAAKLQKALLRIGKQRYTTIEEAESALSELNKKALLHSVTCKQIIEHKAYKGKGRPKADTEYALVFEAVGSVQQDPAAIESCINQGSYYVLATTVPEKELDDEEVIKAYKRQNDSVERGFRFLKDPVFFTSSLFVKKPQRIEGLLMVMTLALLVYSIAQRQVRNHLKESGETLPNQINQNTDSPTLRWIFQIMEGIDYVTVEIEGKSRASVTGLTPLHEKILCYFPPPVQEIYGLVA